MPGYDLFLIDTTKAANPKLLPQDNWQPALEKLVASIGEKFSAAFDRTYPTVPRSLNVLILLGFVGIGCAGEIRISEHEDYDKWAIDILVKFRDSEKLQLLTGQRQSGGVSTPASLMNEWTWADYCYVSGTFPDHYSLPYESYRGSPSSVFVGR